MNKEAEVMRTSTKDLEDDRAEQRHQWDNVAAGWKKWWRTIEDGAQCVSKRMVELAEVEPGQQALDIATGIGEPAMLVARRVGPAGRVVAMDFSAQMLEIARQRARTLGLTNVEFIEADAESLDFPDGSFDSIFCRWGLTSLSKPLHTLALIRSMLTPAGSFAAAVWKEGTEGRPLAGLATAVAHEMFDLLWPTQSSASAEPEEGLDKKLIQAGFKDVRIEEITLILTFPSAQNCIEYLMDVSPELAALLANQSSGQQAEYRRRLAEKLRPYVTSEGGVQIPNVTFCAAGRKG
ncbi:class I SAM-dependent methyltransferase [Bowmanella dokdonensis]|uniref:Class I SAM-dependent methyltransferase n=1 Tax=Bowmanella dokdonensis TaxID=751969 RepID=A0A939DR27_9ALTE|nr:class I SAM-dependent methyltransferase [Bowmanella dokdonensis]MBN7827257.1 class I SAM-dependent methyltransferase [Bowmanella dokdonensis]